MSFILIIEDIGYSSSQITYKICKVILLTEMTISFTKAQNRQQDGLSLQEQNQQKPV